MLLNLDTCLDILFGVAVGDALGVPVEFLNRSELMYSPVSGMTGYGSHNMPPGTFSDDSSLTFCLAEALTSSYDINIIAENFIKWRCDNYWTATGVVFDVGITTQNAIERLVKGIRPDLAGDFDVWANGNGSLMRILPLMLYLHNKPVDKRYLITKEVSSITHGHVRSAIACFYYLEFALKLIQGKDKFDIYNELQSETPIFLQSIGIVTEERYIFNRLLVDRIDMMPMTDIKSSGYVLHTLEASIYCLLTTDNYKDAVLKAINMGDDTDTTGAVTGGLAALLYGHKTIPAEWLDTLARKDDIEDLAARMFNNLSVF